VDFDHEARARGRIAMSVGEVAAPGVSIQINARLRIFAALRGTGRFVTADREDRAEGDVRTAEAVLSPSPAVAPAAPPARDLAPAADRAFDALIAEHLPALRARAAQLCRATVDPDDVIQDALVRAFRARGQLKDAGHARGWLLAIVTNTFLDALRRRRVRPGEVELAIDPPAPTAEVDAPWARLDVDDVRAAVAELPDDVRETYRRFALEGQDYVAIAAALGVPKGTIGSRIVRARKQLRAILAARSGGAP
jgi:RNA polymerase sigma-70 factor (ECF subfamily)